MSTGASGGAPGNQQGRAGDGGAEVSAAEA